MTLKGNFKLKTYMHPNSLKNLTSAYRFKKGHPKSENAYVFPKGHKTNVGKPKSEKQKEMARKAMLGNKHAAGGRGNTINHSSNNKSYSFGHTPWNKGISCSQETKDRIRKKNKGRVASEEERIKMRIASKKRGCKPPIRKGSDNNKWKGGVTPENRRIRHSIEFRLWREAVFARDNWICQKYSIKGGVLHPHHIKNFAEYPELRFAIDNGITLSEKAHREFHKKYGTKNNNEEQLIEFLYE